MSRKIDIDNLFVDAELNICTNGLATLIQSDIEYYISEGNTLDDIEDLAYYIAIGLKEEQGDRNIFNITTRLDHYRADEIR